MKEKRKIVAILLMLTLIFQTTVISLGMETASPDAAQKTGPLAGLYICVDPGHGNSNNKVYEFVAPTSKETKRAFVSGTRGSKVYGTSDKSCGGKNAEK